MENQIKVLITGGHLTPAIAVIEEMKKENIWDITYIGRKITQEGSSIPSREVFEIPNLGVRFMTIPAGKIPRHFDFYSFRAIGKIPLGILKSLWIIWRVKPDIIMSFGGYVGASVAIAGRIKNIPIVSHEQTVTKGLANALIERIADKIVLSWEETQKEYRKKTRVLGNPIRKTIIEGPGKPVPIQLNKVPMIYITGGNQGSHIINLVVADCLKELTKSFVIIHQCGMGKAGQDYKMLMAVKESLTKKQHDRYFVKDWFSDEEVAWILRNSELVVSRSGANIVTELSLLGKISILIPLPISGKNEQFKNALLLKKAGTAEIIKQKELSAPLLIKTIKSILKNQINYKRNLSDVKKMVNPNAAKDIVKLLKRVYEERKA